MQPLQPPQQQPSQVPEASRIPPFLEVARGLFSGRILRLFRQLAAKRAAAFATLGLAGLAITWLAIGAGAPPSIPPVVFPSTPLFGGAQPEKPSLALALSVEYPTSGPAHPSASGYANTNEYLGHFDAESCYSYNTKPADVPSGADANTYKRFDRSGPADKRMCADAFSGNFLNWASSSAIDIFRMALSGGDRIVDTPTLTVLQRTVLPGGGLDPECWWNNPYYFKYKVLGASGGGTGMYYGAIPVALRTEVGGANLYVYNILNRIYFGKNIGGNCADQRGFNFGAAIMMSPSVTTPGALPADAVQCAVQWEVCKVTSGVKEIWYGVDTRWSVITSKIDVNCAEYMFGDPAPGVGKTCFVRDGVSTATMRDAGPLSTDPFFYSRVAVCGRNAKGELEDVRDYGLCKQYPAGNYKPIGAIQRYADNLRLAAFGYLMDHNQWRYGGVLRAPMKFVGARTFDITGKDNTPASGNPNAEWNSSTGVFYDNPDGDTTQSPPISGVINYLNKFGRTGVVPGRYKAYDPVGELHYEVVRYMQGMQPDPYAIADYEKGGIAPPHMADGFPFATSWKDPFGDGRSPKSDYSCVRATVAMIGDVFSWDKDRIPAPDPANNVPDIKYWRSTVIDFERNTGATYRDGQGISRTASNPNTPNVTGGWTDYLQRADLSQLIGTAYWSHTHDIRGTGWTNAPDKQRPGLRLNHYFFDVDSGANAATRPDFRKSGNQFFMGAKYGGFESDPGSGKPYNTFGNPFVRDDGVVNNDVWQDPANPGEAKRYYLQSNARNVFRAFDQILRDASSSARSIAGAAVSNKNFTRAGNTVYQGGFDTSDWSGDVHAMPVAVGSNFTISIGGAGNWSAAERLELMESPATRRNIVMGRFGATVEPVAVDFTWDKIDTALQAQLSKAKPAAAADALGQDRLNYIRGDRSREGTTFRKRSKLLGGVVNSGVVYSGTAAASLASESGYAAFQARAATRKPAVFAGANDGMLHAFDAKTGDELFAYIPSWMGPQLAALTALDYSHRDYVDAPPAVAEARVGDSGSDWKTVLVSGTGAGGRGVFALDVTDPESFSASNAMWEFTQADDPDMGFVVSRPQIVKMRVSAPGAAPKYRWFAAVASGVNNYMPDGAGIFSATGRPALFLLALDKKPGTAWTSTGESPNYYKVSLPVDPAAAATHATGLLGFSATLGSSREVAQIYAGDLHGNLWKLDFAARGASEWTMEKLSAFSKGSAPAPLYIARTAAGGVQPITMAPSLVAGNEAGGPKSIFVAFGTGKFLEVADTATAQSNSLYVVHDNGTSEADSESPIGAIVSGRGRLAKGQYAGGVITVPAFTWGRPKADDDSSQRSGWYFDFAAAGERQISNAIVTGDRLVFGSTIPAPASANCKVVGGGQEYIVNVDTGSGASKESSVGLLGEPILASMSEATAYTLSTSTGRRTQTVVQQVLQQGAGGISTSTRVTSTAVAGRLSWRQVNNYQDVKASP